MKAISNVTELSSIAILIVMLPLSCSAVNSNRSASSDSSTRTSRFNIRYWAGSPNEERGYRDRPGDNARFDGPGNLAVDRADDLYVIDIDNGKIRKVTSLKEVSTIAGDDLSGKNQLGSPGGIAVDSHGIVYFSDVETHKIFKLSSAGIITVFAGAGGAGFLDGPAKNAKFSAPIGMAVDSNDNIYIADVGNNRVRKISPNGSVSTLAGSGMRGYQDGPGERAKFDNPTSLAVDTHGNVYVLDLSNRCIRKIAPNGDVSLLAGSGEDGVLDGPSDKAQFHNPHNISIDSLGNVYVAEDSAIRKVTPNGVVSTVVKGVASKLFGIIIDRRNIIYVSSRESNFILAVLIEDIIPKYIASAIFK